MVSISLLYQYEIRKGDMLSHRSLVKFRGAQQFVLKLAAYFTKDLK